MVDDTPESWDPTYRADWAEAVAQWPWQEWEDGLPPAEGWLKTGPCPRCDHPITIKQHQGRFIDRPWVGAACNCGQPHPGRPDDDPNGGCGPTSDLRGVG